MTAALLTKPAHPLLSELLDMAPRAEGGSVPVLLAHAFNAGKLEVQILTLAVRAGVWTLKAFWTSVAPDFEMLYQELQIPGDAVVERVAGGVHITWAQAA